MRLAGLLAAVVGPGLGLCALHDADGVPLPVLASRQVEVPSVNYFRRRCLHSIAVLGNKLYIEGGEISQFVDGVEDPGPHDSRPVNVTVSLPLDTPWTNTTLTITPLTSHPNPILKNFALWPDVPSNRLLSWGGDGPYGSTAGARNKTVWAFTPFPQDSGTWAPTGPANPETFLSIRRNTQAAAAVCGRTAYYLGGWAGPPTDASLPDTNIPTPGLLRLDLASGAWANDSAPDRLATLQAGEALCAPFGGAAGVLVVLGGLYSSATDYAATRQLSMADVAVYDPAAGAWHAQTASGDVPDDRSWFCAAGAAGPNGTWEVVVYGGYNNIKVLGDVYVLSLPGFVWFKAPAEGGAAPPRHIHKCAVVGKGASQMISVGGLGSRFNSWVVDATDTWSQGIGVLDMSSLTWKAGYEPDAAQYQSPEVVRAFYAKGGLDSVSWSSSEVKDLFVKGTSGPPSGNNGGGDSNNNSKNNNNAASSPPIGAIVGGVLGGIALIALVAIAFFWRQRRQNLRRTTPELDSSMQQQRHLQQQHGGYYAEAYKGVVPHRVAELDPHATPRAELGPGYVEAPRRPLHEMAG